MNPSKTDEESVQADVAMLLRYGIGAAVTLDRGGVQPRSVTFLGRTVRSGGTGYTARLPELLPEPAASALMRGWLEAIAELIGLRRTTRERAAR
ncbi:hypothetical protein AB0D37_23460 [Streptomyces sp. NPDC048384]|uniref:hypothetical protein n=1 Tax=Streptomyces sp. NPDC048384 TaxID=3155487 RepID=UPI003448D3D4